MHKLTKSSFRARITVPAMLILVSGLAFGVWVPWLGFYWDDWPLAWFTHVLGPQGFIGYAPYRPFSGVLYAISTAVVGTTPLGWQLYGILWRWLAALVFWLLLRLIWPRREGLAMWAALCFLVYPGFSQQSIALIYSLYFIYYTLFLLSLAVMVQGLRDPQRSRYWNALGLLLAAGVMFSTEYFYGLELLRPLITWFVLIKDQGDWRQVGRKIAGAWLPYLLLVIVVFAWRFSISSEETYAVTALDVLAADPLGGSWGYVVTSVSDGWEALVPAWSRVFDLSILWQQGPLTNALHWTVVVVSGGIVAWTAYFNRNTRDHPQPGSKTTNRSKTVLLLGAAALLVGGLSFWAAGLPLRLVYPWDRGFLPMAFGASLVAGWMFGQLDRWQWVQVGIITLLVALAVSFHFRMGITYRQAWERQKEFFQQLVWRAPGLEPNTVVLTTELDDLVYYTDDSLTAPLNWIYAPQLSTLEMPYMLNFIGPGWGGGLPALEPDRAILQQYRQFTFMGSTSQVIVVHYRQGQCLRVLDPLFDANARGLPAVLETVLALSDPAGIVRVDAEAALPEKQFGQSLEQGWCYYFQKADLARQQGDWQQVAALGDIAFSLDESPNRAAERLPFIEGYARIDNWERAQELADEALAIDPAVRPMVCNVWQRLKNGNEGTLPDAIQTVFECEE